VIEDGVLCEIHIEKQTDDEQTESLFLGKIQTIKPSLHAAFVDIGSELNAFLPLREDMNLRCGDFIIVQGQAKQATETKGLRITDRMNLAGKWLVLLPNGSGVHISKKVKNPALRKVLSILGESICPPDCGLIIRTAGEDVTEESLVQEAAYLHALWLDIQKKALGMSKPGLLHGRIPLHLRLTRDICDLSKIVINNKSDYDQLCAAQMSLTIPQCTQIVHHSENHSLIFDAYNIETSIDKALRKRVWLPCGGYLVIDYCEAMTVIDVNSGKMVLGCDLEETALAVNLEAAAEIARQLRLRDIGGIIVIDFIDMRSEEHRRQLIQKMKNETARDRAQVSVEGITRLGLMEVSRKRKNAQLHKTLRCSCSYCSGMGEVLAGDEVARRMLRQIRRMSISGQRGPFLARCSASAAHALSNMTAPEDLQVYICVSGGRHAEKYDIEQFGTGMPLPSGAVALKKRTEI